MTHAHKIYLSDILKYTHTHIHTHTMYTHYRKYMHMHTCMLADIYIYIYMCMQAYAWLCACMQVCICLWNILATGNWTCVCVCVCVCVHKCASVCVGVPHTRYHVGICNGKSLDKTITCPALLDKWLAPSSYHMARRCGWWIGSWLLLSSVVMKHSNEIYKQIINHSHVWMTTNKMLITRDEKRTTLFTISGDNSDKDDCWWWWWWWWWSC